MKHTVLFSHSKRSKGGINKIKCKADETSTNQNWLSVLASKLRCAAMEKRWKSRLQCMNKLTI